MYDDDEYYEDEDYEDEADIIHIEGKRRFFSGISTTLCGETFKVTKASWFLYNNNCQACADIDYERKQERRNR